MWVRAATAASTALTIAAELGDARRFGTAPSTMAYVGLVPSEHSSGTKRAQGGITKTGNAHLRRASSNRRGITAIMPSSATRYAPDNAAHLRRSSRRPGPRSSGCIGAPNVWRHAASRNNTSSLPSPASSRASSGPR